MKIQRTCAAFIAAATIAGTGHATNVALAADGSWNEFTVDNQATPAFGTGWIDFTDGSPLTFSFTVAAGSIGTLTVVDAGFAGDTFVVTDFGTAIGATSSVPIGTTDGPVTFDFDQALADPAWSHGVFTFAAGTYRIGGWLQQSVLDNGVALDATDGAVNLHIAAIPEPTTWAMLFAGLGLVGFIACRRARGESV